MKQLYRSTRQLFLLTMKTFGCLVCVLNWLLCRVTAVPAVATSDLSSFFSQLSVPQGSFRVRPDASGQIGIYYSADAVTGAPLPEDDSEDSDNNVNVPASAQSNFQYVMPKFQMPSPQMSSDRFVRSSRNSDDGSGSSGSNTRSSQGRSASNADDSSSPDDRTSGSSGSNNRNSNVNSGSSNRDRSPSSRQDRPTATGQASKSGSSSRHTHREASGVGRPPAFTMPSDIAHGLSGNWDDDDF